ncbi:hypothetical protein M5K25_010792 [Dendrobium thyrsiflorum]|uniref:Uncharacterized protein n=1 Tax=Dendrobium thyrsiflorum TaxID=117978 RepID=A0ABD0V831_DENTH
MSQAFEAFYKENSVAKHTTVSEPDPPIRIPILTRAATIHPILRIYDTIAGSSRTAGAFYGPEKQPRDAKLPRTVDEPVTPNDLRVTFGKAQQQKIRPKRTLNGNTLTINYLLEYLNSHLRNSSSVRLTPHSASRLTPRLTDEKRLEAYLRNFKLWRQPHLAMYLLLVSNGQGGNCPRKSPPTGCRVRNWIGSYAADASSWPDWEKIGGAITLLEGKSPPATPRTAYESCADAYQEILLLLLVRETRKK